MIKIPCPNCNWNIPLDKEESIYEKYLICLCGNNFRNPNFIGEIELNNYLKVKNGR